jgi:hypothetical protein
MENSINSAGICAKNIASFFFMGAFDGAKVHK